MAAGIRRPSPCPRQSPLSGSGEVPPAAPFAITIPGYRVFMTDNDSSVWRDEQRTPLEELDKAIARSPVDGQSDDVTGSDAGAESEFGHGPEAVDRGAGAVERREMTDPERAYRPSTTGRTGPDV